MADHEEKSTNIMAEGAMDIVAVYFFLKMAKKEKKCKSQTRFCNAEIFAIRALSDALAIVHGEMGETHVAILVAIEMLVVIAFRLTTDGAFSVSSAIEFDLKDSKIVVRKDFNIAEVRQAGVGKM